MRVLEAVPTELPSKGWGMGMRVESQRSRVGSTLEWAVFFWPLFSPKRKKMHGDGTIVSTAARPQGGKSLALASRAAQWPRHCQGSGSRAQAPLVPASSTSSYPSRTAVNRLL